MNTYRVWSPDLQEDEDDGEDILEVNHEKAAVLWVQRYDAEDGGYAIGLGDCSIHVHVKEGVDGSTKIYQVSGYMTYCYDTEELEGDK